MRSGRPSCSTLDGLLSREIVEMLQAYSGVQVGIPQFVDDDIFIGEASVGNITTIKCILRCFEMASSLKVNFSRSKFAGT